MKENKDREKKKRILCIGPLPPPVHGAAMMTQIIKDSEFINTALDLDWVNLSTSRKMEEIGQGSMVKIVRLASSFLKTFWKLLIRKYDVCYCAITCHGSGFLKDAPFVLICKVFGNKVILHQHNKGMSTDADRPLFRWLLKKVYRKSRVILLSWRLYPDIEKIVDKNLIKICPNGIPEVTRDRNRHDGRPVILFLSNLIESKGVIVLLDACKILKQRGYDFECRFVGGETIEIDKSRFIKETASRQLNDNVVYIGSKYGNDKHMELSKADIFVFPTYYHNECFPLVILEAMQHSLPIVSTDEGGIPDIIDNGQTGIIVPSKNPEILSEALARLIDSPEWSNTLGRNGERKYNSNYTLRNFERNILDCLTEHI